MAESPNKPELPLGLAAPPPRDGVSGTEVSALILSAAWIVLVAGLLVFLPAAEGFVGFDSLRFVLTILALVMPVALIWIGAAALRSARIVQDESRRIQAAIDSMRVALLADRQARSLAGSGAPGPVERKLGEITQATRATETGLATFSTTREPARQPAVRSLSPRLTDDQPTLALGTPADEGGPPLTRSDMIRALNFPDTEKDEQGFAALRLALRDRMSRQLIQASQDVLTLLSQDGIYMDDLRPDRAKPEVWRRFSQGERGRTVAALGGVRDRSFLALTMGRMREDTIFRDAAHHFLRLFDRMLVSFEPDATDEDIADLSETRTARAFMLLGRVTGAFD